MTLITPQGGEGTAQEILSLAERHFHRMLEKMGVVRALRRAGVKDGDTVVIGSVEFEWRE